VKVSDLQAAGQSVQWLASYIRTSECSLPTYLPVSKSRMTSAEQSV